LSPHHDRFKRQEELVPREKLAELLVSVIGVGAIGRQVAVQLAALGVRRLQLIDFDHVEETNISTQGYLRRDLGRPKVGAAAESIQEIDRDIEVLTIEDRWRSRQRLGSVVFCCVDSIQTRTLIWKSVGRQCEFWCDGRMLGEVMRILTVADHHGRAYYPTTLFDSREAQAGECTSRGVIYTAAIAAGLMLGQFARWLRGIPVECDQTLNLLTSELTVPDFALAAR
jgi:sulfur carrier protein ThiS adenylyltransferase